MQHFGGTLAAHDISVHRGADAILERVSLAVTPGSRIGVVGPNGRGKTTLLRALAGLEVDGSVRRNPPSLRVGTLAGATFSRARAWSSTGNGGPAGVDGGVRSAPLPRSGGSGRRRAERPVADLSGRAKPSPLVPDLTLRA